MFDASEVLDVIGCRENLAWCRVPDSESQVKIQESIKGKYASISSKVTIYWRSSLPVGTGGSSPWPPRSPSPVNIFILVRKTLCIDSFSLFLPYCCLPDEEKSETLSSNKQGLNAFCFLSLIYWGCELHYHMIKFQCRVLVLTLPFTLSSIFRALTLTTTCFTLFEAFIVLLVWRWESW